MRGSGVPVDDAPIYPLPGGWPGPADAGPPADAGLRPSAQPRWRRPALILTMIALVVVVLLSLRAVVGAAAADPDRPHPHPAVGCHTAGSGPT
jgi:hypothetical protein